MSHLQLMQIQMPKVKCDQVYHETKSIKYFCLCSECNESIANCNKCLLRGHLGCRSQILELKELPQKLVELSKLQLAVVALQEKINKQFNELLSRIEQLLQPISKFQNVPNLTNLKGIGQLSRRLPKQSILQSIDETKIRIRSLLDNQNLQEVNVQVEPNLSADEWYLKGMALFNQNIYDEALFREENYNEAIKCFQKAIEINPNHPLAQGSLRECQEYYRNYQQRRR